MDPVEMKKKIEKEFGSRIALLGHQILMLSMGGQPCDITFFKGEPAINVKIDSKITLAIMYGAGATKLRDMLEHIKLSNGKIVRISEIWTINPMPKGGFSKDDLDAVDMSKPEEKIRPQGETLREMIRDTYHCKSREDEDYYLRRYIAS